MYSEFRPYWTDDDFLLYGSYIQHIKNIGTFGLSLHYYSLGENVWTSENPVEGETFRPYEYTLSGSFGYRLCDHIALGLSLKYIHSRIGGPEYKAGKGFAFDIGYLHHDLIVDGLNLGLNLSNMGTPIKYEFSSLDDNKRLPLPTNLIMGLAYNLIDGEPGRFSIGIGFSKVLTRENNDFTFDPWYKAIFTSWFEDNFQNELRQAQRSVGFEYSYGNFLSLRSNYTFYDYCQYGYLYSESGNQESTFYNWVQYHYWTYSLGIQCAPLGFDISYFIEDPDDEQGGTAKFSITYGSLEKLKFSKNDPLAFKMIILPTCDFMVPAGGKRREIYDHTYHYGLKILLNKNRGAVELGLQFSKTMINSKYINSFLDNIHGVSNREIYDKTAGKSLKLLMGLRRFFPIRKTTPYLGAGVFYHSNEKNISAKYNIVDYVDDEEIVTGQGEVEMENDISATIGGQFSLGTLILLGDHICLNLETGCQIPFNKGSQVNWFSTGIGLGYCF